MEERTIDNLVCQFLARVRRLERLCSFKEAPTEIIKTSKRLVDESVKMLLDRGFDAKEWFKSPKGQVAYLEYCVDDDQFSNARRRCERCSHYCWTDAEGKTDFFCPLHAETLLVCSDFSETGKDFWIRLNDALERCTGCINHKEYKEEFGFALDRCGVRCNRFAEKCPQKTVGGFL